MHAADGMRRRDNRQRQRRVTRRRGPDASPSAQSRGLVREAQRRITETVPGTALAVTIDLADKPGEGGHGNNGTGPKSIHPIHKREVGERNALAALRERKRVPKWAPVPALVRA